MAMGERLGLTRVDGGWPLMLSVHQRPVGHVSRDYLVIRHRSRDVMTSSQVALGRVTSLAGVMTSRRDTRHDIENVTFLL